MGRRRQRKILIGIVIIIILLTIVYASDFGGIKTSLSKINLNPNANIGASKNQDIILSVPDTNQKILNACTQKFNDCVAVFNGKYGTSSTTLKILQVTDASQVTPFLQTFAAYNQGRQLSSYAVAGYPVTLFAVSFHSQQISGTPYAFVCDSQENLIWSDGINAIC